MIVWDERKRELNRAPPPVGHGLDFAAAERFEWDTALVGPTYPSRSGRKRFIAIGFLDDALVALIFSPLGSEAVSLVCLRPASKKERTRYAEAWPDDQ